MTAAHKNVYEELIDNLIIEEVAGMDDDIRQTLKGLSTNKKRMAILSILDKDRDLFLKIKEEIKNNELSKTAHIKNVVKMMRDYVKVGDFERKTAGEVQTPLELVNDMLDTLPSEVWSNPKLRWLDNSTGTGIFISVIVERLMKGLIDFEKDDDKRYRHIMEEMIYMSELQSKNCFIYLCCFDPLDEYGLNVYNGSFLTEGFNNHMRDVWEVEKFDVIVMNPPYQELKEGNKKSQPLWDKFVNKSIVECLAEDGYMVAVHPSGWRNVDGMFKDTQRLLRSKQVEYLEVHSFKDGLKTFGAKIDYDFYCLRNIENKNNITNIKCVDGTVEKVEILDMEFIPSENIKQIQNLIAKSGEERVHIMSSSSYHTQRTEMMSKEKTDLNIFPCVYMVGYGQNVKLWWSNINKNVHFNIPKVIWANGASDVIVDKTGQYGLTQFAYAIVDNSENLDKIKKAMDNPKFIKGVMNYRDGLGDKYNRKVIATFRKDFWKNFI